MREEDFSREDMMASLAFWEAERAAADAILSSVPDALSKEDSERAEQVFQDVMARWEEKEKQAQRQLIKSRTRRVFARVIQAAACLVVVMAIAIPAAVAWVPAFRARVLQLLVQVDQQAGEAYVTFEEDVQSAFDVPAEWAGKYFPAWMPSGMEVSYISQYGRPWIEYGSKDGRKISFSENDENTSMTAGTEGADVYHLSINGRSTFVTESQTSEEHFISFVWATDTKWFELATFNITKEEAIRIAESVKEIVK